MNFPHFGIILGVLIMVDKRFVIRVYAVLINDLNQVLLSDEYVRNSYLTKFPGGGLEWGEGPADCLKREALEEFGQSIEIIGHFYTNDFFEKSMFYEESQLFSIYYLAQFNEPIKFKISTKPFDFTGTVHGSQSFRWTGIHDLELEELTFQVDRKVAQLLKSGDYR
jgi:ADP-ribose pyrophosphatase YjhB (NUDIX family)